MGGNTRKAIGDSITGLMDTLLKNNSLKENRIISIVISVTVDLTAANPATLLRGSGKFASTPLFTVQEAVFDESPRDIIRVLVHARKRSGRSPVPVYINGAEKLRTDLFPGT